MTAKTRGWTLEVSRKQLQNSALYCLDRSKVMEVDLDAVETQIQKLRESDTTISDFDSVEIEMEDKSVMSMEKDSVVDVNELPNAYPYENPVKSQVEHEKQRLRAWMSSTTMAISQKVKSLMDVQRKLLEKTNSNIGSPPNMEPLPGATSSVLERFPSEHSSEPKTLDLQSMAKVPMKPTKCYLEFSEMATTPALALSSLDPFVIGKAIDVMKAMKDNDWEKVKHLYEMFKRAGRLDQLIIYEFAIKVIVNTRGKSGVLEVLRDIDEDLAEGAFRFGKTLLGLFHGSVLLSDGVDVVKPNSKTKPPEPAPPPKEEIIRGRNRGAQIPEHVRKSFYSKKSNVPKRASYAYLFKDAAAQQKKTTVKNVNKCQMLKRNNVRQPPQNKPIKKQPNPKYAHVKSRYREAAKVKSQPGTPYPHKTWKSTTAAPLTMRRGATKKTRQHPASKIIKTPESDSLDVSPANPQGTPSSSFLNTPDSVSESNAMNFERNDTRGFVENLKDLVKNVKNEDEYISRETAKAEERLRFENDESYEYEDAESYDVINVDPYDALNTGEFDIFVNEAYDIQNNYEGPTGDFINVEPDTDNVNLDAHTFGKGDEVRTPRMTESETKPGSRESEEKYCVVSDQDVTETNFSVTTLYKQLPNLRPFIIDRLLMNVLLAYLLAVTGGALCADDSKSLYCTLSLTLKEKLRTMLIRALRLVDDF